MDLLVNYTSTHIRMLRLLTPFICTGWVAWWRRRSLYADVSIAPRVCSPSALPAPVVRPLPFDRRRPTLPVSVSLPLPRFATQDITRIGWIGRDSVIPIVAGVRVVNPLLFSCCYLRITSVWRRVCGVFRHVVCYEPVSLIPQVSPVSAEVVDRGVVESPVSEADLVPSDMSSVTCRCTPLNP